MATVKKQITVTEYLTNLQHPLKEVVLNLQQLLLTTSTEIGVQVKWNSLSFYYTGAMKPFDPKEYKRDIVVLNLSKLQYVLLVFPTGNIINDTTNLLGGNFTDSRKTLQISTLEELSAKQQQLQFVIKQWLSLIEK